MFLLNVSYSKSPTEVALHKPEHLAWVEKYRKAGAILFAGPKKSGLGGIILTRSMPKSALMEILGEDSYVIADVVDYQISDFDISSLAEGVILGKSDEDKN